MNNPALFTDHISYGPLKGAGFYAPHRGVLSTPMGLWLRDFRTILYIHHASTFVYPRAGPTTHEPAYSEFRYHNNQPSVTNRASHHSFVELVRYSEIFMCNLANGNGRHDYFPSAKLLVLRMPGLLQSLSKSGGLTLVCDYISIFLNNWP